MTRLTSLILRIAFFALVIVAVAGFNSYVLNGPMLQHNVHTSVQQLNDKVPATAGDFKIGDFWLTFHSVYVVEVVFIGLLGAAMFLPGILRCIFPPNNTVGL